MNPISKLPTFCAAAVIGTLLAGCVPVPLASGYQDASRQNVPASVPDAIVQGVSSRADVLLALGEPDRSADDESWFLYGSVYSKGGLMLVGAIGGPYSAALVGIGEETMRYRLLTVRFDAKGIVSGVELTQRLCREWLGGVAGSGSSSGRSDPCVDTSGDATVMADRAVGAAQGELVIAQFQRVGWWAALDRPPDVPMWSPPSTIRGAWVGLAVTDRTVVLVAAPDSPPANLLALFTLEAPAEPMRIPLASIAHATADRRLFMSYGHLAMTNGSSASFIVFDDNGICDGEQTRAAAKLINERIKAMATDPPTNLPVPPPSQ